MSEHLPFLDRAALTTLRSARRGVVELPDESLLDLPERAVQFGTGAFLRGFVDDFLHRANQRGLFGGRIAVIGSTGSTRDRAINEQNGLYTLAVEGIESGESVQEMRIVSSISRAISAADDWDEVLALARAPLLQFVFSNTTEVGIMLHATDAPDDAPPHSFPAKLTRFLFERAREFDYDPSAGLVVIPCELIEDNGTRLKEIVLQLADRWSLDPRFSGWLDDAVPFCNTLVDRIVPGTPKGDDARRLANAIGYQDALLTMCEPYRLFAIEGDDAMRERLGWASVDPGVIVTPDVRPYRERKVRLLNGAHTLLVSAALPMGCETVRDAMSTQSIARYVRKAMFDEIVPVLDAAGAAEFAEAVTDRFRNPFIRHALVDITLQATMKMRLRVIPSIVRYVERFERVPGSLAFGFAAYLLFMQGRFQASRREAGLSVPPDDQGEHLRALWERVPEDRMSAVGDLVWVACSDTSLWGADLTAIPGFSEAVADHLWRARAHGMGAALEHHLTSTVETK